MACPHCYQSCGKDKQELSLEQFEALCQSAARAGAARIALSGGEALLHSQFDRLVEAIERHGLVFTALFTNGTNVRDAFAKTRPWTQVLFSHSPSLGQGLSEETLQEIARLSKKGRLVTFSSLTQTGAEVLPIFEQMKALAPKVKARLRWRVGVVRPVGRGQSLKNDLPAVKAKYLELFARWNQEVRQTDAFDLQIGFAFRSDFVRHGRIDLYKDDSKCCEYKESSLCVKWDGGVTYCTMDESRLGQVGDIETIWAQISQAAFRNLSSKDIDACSSCTLRSTCNGGCRLCAAPGACDRVSQMTYEFLADIMPTLTKLGVRAA
jgi:radical SAM protein with 4Fe4S-binding SPASM domain